MTAPFYLAYSGHSLDMGVITVTPSIESADLTGSTAILRIGKIGQAALITLDSATPPEEGVFQWDDAGGTLTVDLPASTFEALAIGLYWYQVTITTVDGDPLPPPLQGQIRLADVVRAAV